MVIPIRPNRERALPRPALYLSFIFLAPRPFLVMPRIQIENGRTLPPVSRPEQWDMRFKADPYPSCPHCPRPGSVYGGKKLVNVRKALELASRYGISTIHVPIPGRRNREANFDDTIQVRGSTIFASTVVSYVLHISNNYEAYDTIRTSYTSFIHL